MKRSLLRVVIDYERARSRLIAINLALIFFQGNSMCASRTERHRYVYRREKLRLSNGAVMELPSFRHRCCRQRCRRQFAKALGAKLVLAGLTELGFGPELNARLFIPPLPFRRRRPRSPLATGLDSISSRERGKLWQAPLASIEN